MGPASKRTETRSSAETGRASAATETVRISTTNPEAIVIEEGDRVWSVAAIPDPGVRAAVEDGATFEEVRSLLIDSPGEYSLVQVSTADGLTVRAHRGITSAYDVYFTRASNGDVVVTDLFRNALSHLDVEDRTVTEDIVADHLLYRTTPAEAYVDEVGRLGHGETLRWDVTSGITERTQAETLDVADEVDSDTAVDRLEAALERVTSVAGDADTASMLSGGVDSTLLHTFLPDGTPSASAAFDAPEFEFEIEYAEAASDLLGTDHDLRVADEETFCDRLEETIDAMGMPPQQLQSPTIDLAFRTDYDAYVNGFLADALFGMRAARARKVWWTRPLRHLPSVVSSLEMHEQMASKLERSPWDPTSMAQQFSQYLPQEYVAEFVGEETVERRQLARLRYVRPRVSLAEDSPSFATHMDWGHWIEFFCESTVNDYRQIAQARGKSMRAPFASSEVAEVALAVPSPDRYVGGLEDKHIPKKLLGRRVPGYETSKPKGNGNLPVGRYLREGPLVEAQERYDLPEFAPASDWAEIREEHPGMGWILVSWAIWRDRVLRNPALEEAPATSAIEVSVEPAAPRADD